MLLENHACRSDQSGQQDKATQPSQWIEMEDDAIREKPSGQHAATGCVGADFPFQVDASTS